METHRQICLDIDEITRRSKLPELRQDFVPPEDDFVCRIELGNDMGGFSIYPNLGRIDSDILDSAAKQAGLTPDELKVEVKSGVKVNF